MALFVPTNSFQWSANSYGATWTAAGFGVSHTPGSNDAKAGLWTNSGLGTLAYDVYQIEILIGNAGVAGALHLHFADIGIDYAGGTSYTVAIPNLGFGGCSVITGAIRWVFPLFIPAGATIGFRAQHQATASAVRFGVKVWGRPTHPELVKAGTYVETLGADTSVTLGTTILTSGSTCKINGAGESDWSASIGTITRPSWWWQTSFLLNDASTTKYATYFVDVAASTDAGTTKLLVVDKVGYSFTDTEQATADIPMSPAEVPAGATVYTRALYTGATMDTGPYVVVHALGG